MNEFPPLRPGKVHAYKVWPDGRWIYQQYGPEMLDSPDEADRKLESGKPARLSYDVMIKDIHRIMNKWK